MLQRVTFRLVVLNYFEQVLRLTRFCTNINNGLTITKICNNVGLLFISSNDSLMFTYVSLVTNPSPYLCSVHEFRVGLVKTHPRTSLMRISFFKNLSKMTSNRASDSVFEDSSPNLRNACMCAYLSKLSWRFDRSILLGMVCRSGAAKNHLLRFC